MRLFVALEPPLAVRGRIAARLAELAPALPAARWSRSEALHVTLAFLGEVEPDRVEPLAAALEGRVAERPAFAARIAGAGAFPARGAARVLWLGLTPEAPLQALAGAARAAVAAAGLEFDTKPFRPHLTVARCRSGWSAEARDRAVAALAALPPLDFEVGAVELIESRLDAAGARYSGWATAPLGAPE